MQNHPATKKHYLGTFSVDNLPMKIRYPSCFIFNNQKSNQTGQHWIAVHFDQQKKAELFDSFANSPKHYGISEYLQKHSVSVNYNKKVLQGFFSPYCGVYCILYLIYKCRSKTLNSFLKYFKSSRENDNIFSKLIKKYA